MKLELKHLAPYLPYKLTCVDDFGMVKVIDWEYQSYTNTIVGLNHVINSQSVQVNCFKILLRPLSDIAYHLDFLNKYHVYYDKKEGCMVKRKNETYTRLNELEYLFKHHFDVFGLIPQGLAIDINTLNK